MNRALQAVRENRVTVEKPLAEALAEEREKKFQKPEATELFTNVRPIFELNSFSMKNENNLINMNM